LELKGIKVRVPFSFDVRIDGNHARMTGSTTFSRKDLNIGQDSDPDADWVSEVILVTVSLESTRASD